MVALDPMQGEVMAFSRLITRKKRVSFYRDAFHLLSS
jgi:hypothetical protein